MTNIMSYILNGSRYIVSFDFGKTFDKYVEDNSKEHILIMLMLNILDERSIQRLLNEYYIHEIFDLSNCYIGTNNEPLMLWHIAKSKPSCVKISVCHIKAHPYRDDEILENKLIIPDKFEENYKQYLDLLNTWNNTGTKPDTIKNKYEFIEISPNEFDNTKPFPYFYRTENTETRLLLRTEEISLLSELASITNVYLPQTSVQHAKVLDIERASYPFLPEFQAVDLLQTVEQLHKEDIVYSKGKVFLINKEPEFPLFAPVASQIIRAKKVCPEYLYLYLSSNTAKRIRRAYQIELTPRSSIDLTSSLRRMPVIKPAENESFYKNEFLKISSPNIRIYDEQKTTIKENTMEQVLTQEIIQKINLQYQELIQKQIDEDIKELNTCYRNGAYKSTLIMAGSIMEAILIDWLSEIRGVNYFEETLNKREWNKSKKTYETDENGNYIYRPNTKADLADYIDEIRDIKRPHWMKEAKEAHAIRDKRNLVHAKLCLKESISINDDTCKMIIDFLKNIIDSRWK